MAAAAHFGQNWPYQHVSMAVSIISVLISARIGANQKKKKRGESDAALSHVGLRCGNLGATLVLSSAWFKLAFCRSLCIHVRHFVEAIQPFLS